MEQQQTPPVQHIIMLPSLAVPENLLPLIADLKDYSVRFINGYKNVLQKSSDQIEWGLVQDQDYCGQAFCYMLKADTNTQDLVKIQVNGNHNIRKATDQMYVLQSNQNNTPAQIYLTLEKLKHLIKQIKQPNQATKLALNLVKSSFSSYQAFEKSAGQAFQKIQQQINLQTEPIIPTVAQVITMEVNAKKLQGDMVKILPKCDPKTGDWDDKDTIQIKLSHE